MLRQKSSLILMVFSGDTTCSLVGLRRSRSRLGEALHRPRRLAAVPRRRSTRRQRYP